MRKALLCSGLLALLAVPFAGQTEGWKKHTNNAGNFGVLFPVDPDDRVNKSDDQIDSHTLMAQDKPYIYMVVYSAMKDEQKVDNATYEVFKNAVFQELAKCQVGTEGPSSHPLSGYISHWYRLNCEMPGKVTILGNLYWGKHYAYAVMVLYPASATDPVAGKKFMESFSVVDAGK